MPASGATTGGVEPRPALRRLDGLSLLGRGMVLRVAGAVEMISDFSIMLPLVGVGEASIA